MDTLKSKRGFVCDMDGVIYHGSRLLEGSKGFVDWLKAEDKRYLFLTNSSARTPRESDLQRYAYKPRHILNDVSQIATQD